MLSERKVAPDMHSKIQAVSRIQAALTWWLTLARLPHTDRRPTPMSKSLRGAALRAESAPKATMTLL
jgi:hypothetical protein